MFDVTKFDVAQKATNEMIANLNDFVITDTGTRDLLFQKCKDASHILKKVNDKRIDLCKEPKAQVKALKEQFEKDRAQWDDLEVEIEKYSRETLIKPLEAMIAKRQRDIITFNQIEFARVEKLRKEEEAKANELLKQKEEEAKKLVGIAKVIAKKEIEQIIERPPEVVQVKAPGREKTVYTWDLLDINKVPDKYLKKTIDRQALEADLGIVKEIPGIQITTSTVLKYN